MGRGGAKLGKDIKGAGVPNDAERATLAPVGTLPPANAEEPVSFPNLEARIAITTRLTALVADETKSAEGAGSVVNVKWREFMRRAARHTTLATLAAQRFENERRAVHDDVQRYDLVIDSGALNDLATRAARRHASQIETLLTQGYAMQAAALAQSSESALAVLCVTMDGERHDIQCDHGAAQRQVEAAQAVVAAARADNDDEATAKFEMEREQVRGANIEAVNELRVGLDHIVDDLEQRFDADHAAYVHGTEESAREFRALFERDAALSAEIDRKTARVEAVTRDMALWRKKAAQDAVGAGQRNEDLRRERNTMQRQFYELKAETSKVRKRANERARTLAVRARHTRRRLTMMLRQTERILNLAERLRHDDEIRIGQDVHVTDVVLGTLNKLHMTREHARQKRDFLRQENEQLKEMLRSYLDQISVTSTALDQNNSLVIVNGKHNLLQPPSELSLSGGVPPEVGVLVARRYDKHRGASAIV